MLTFNQLVLLSFVVLLFLAIRKYRKGDEKMWYAPVTSCAWFHHYGHTKILSAANVRSTVLPVTKEYTQKSVYTRAPERKASIARQDRSRPMPYYTRNPHPSPKLYTTNKPRYARGSSGSSPYSDSSIVDIERGGMLNPKSTRRS